MPFYVALPSPTIDFTVGDGVAEIPIEQRGAEEVATMTGRTRDGRIETVTIVPDGSNVANYGFDVTPARLVTGLITERGVVAPSRDALEGAFPRSRLAAASKRGGRMSALERTGQPHYAGPRSMAVNRQTALAVARGTMRLAALAWLHLCQRIAAAVRSAGPISLRLGRNR